ncbi:MAG TPA: glycosyltransferase [Candidatus Limnocylindrales bacterium]|nr:glycosyltransferase [Candidatus Limnocylindrales bacterium]
MVGKRILFHIHALRTGGAERQLALLVKGLVARDVEPHVVTLYPGGSFWEKLRTWGKVHLISLNRKSKWDFSVIPRLAKYIKTNNIDLIQGWMPPANTFAVIAGLITWRPVVMGVRASNAGYPTLRSKLYLHTDGLLGRWMARAIVCNSERGRLYHVGIGYPKNKLLVIPNGIDIPEDYKFPPPLAHEPPWHIGMLARFDPMKDHPTMFQALRILLDHGEKVILHLYGDGPVDYRTELMILAKNLGISECVKWYGPVEDIWSVLADMDILASSSYGEGMSNALLEGMAAGRIIVATDVGDARALLGGSHGLCGYLVPAKNPEALAFAIKKALKNPEKARQYAQRAQSIVREYYDKTIMIERYHHLYDQILSG